MDFEEEAVSSSVSLQLLLNINSFIFPVFWILVLTGFSLNSSDWFLWTCLAIFSVSEPARLLLGSRGNLKQHPQHLILSLCLACFPGFVLSVGLLGALSSIHPVAQGGLALIAISSGLEIPIGFTALWRLQRARSIRFKLSENN